MSPAPEFIIRQAVMADLEAVVPLVAAITEETEDRSVPTDLLTISTKTVLDSPDTGFCLVADAGGQVVGVVLVTYIWSYFRNGTNWWIQAVYVRPDWRRQGIYTSLYDRVYEAAQGSADAIGIGLRVDPTNDVAKRTYSSLGMSETKSHYETYYTSLVS